MPETDRRRPRGLVPLSLVSGVVVLVSIGAAQGFWLPNLHNGLLAVSFAGVGAYVLLERPGHREGGLFLATGVVEAVIYLGRQVGHASPASGRDWWGWVGVWPVVVALALTTFSVLCFPDGRLPSERWRPVATGLVAVAVLLAVTSALWPVEYASAGLASAHPLHAATPPVVATLWSALAHPAYVAFQALWVVALLLRWRSAGGHQRRQLAALAFAAAASVAALLVGLVGWRSPRAGILAVTVVPLAAGWAVVNGRRLASYAALTWLSRTGGESADLPRDIARAAAEALGVAEAALWMGKPEHLHLVGLWPDTDAAVPPTTLAALTGSPTHHVRPVNHGGAFAGAFVVRHPHPLSAGEARLLDDLAAQAALVLAHQSLAEVIERQQRAGHLDGLSPREQEVLRLIARGLSNAAICEELHLSIKTVEPLVGSIFTKLGLHADAGSNRRVLAALAYVRG